MDENARRRVVEVAEGILAGEIGVIDGSRQLSRLCPAVCTDHLDDDFIPFIGIDSETDALPVGDVRILWSAEALRRKDREIEAAEALYRETAAAACRKLLVRFGGGSDAVV